MSSPSFLSATMETPGILPDAPAEHVLASLHGDDAPADRRPRLALAALALVILLLGGCVRPQPGEKPVRRPADVRAQIARLLPPGTDDPRGWATDIYAAFAAQQIEPSTRNLCATLAVTEQESLFHTNPVVPGLARIARAEIERRAAAHHIPQWALRAALELRSPDGKRYSTRLDAARTERDLSRIYEDLIGSLPLGRQLFGDDNPVRTAGPMQVSVDFAEAYARGHPYPYPVTDSIRHELFTRRGGMYFGIADLLGYPADYAEPIYRFADYNAGRYASRNAAFQNAVSVASGIPLALDGDLVRPDAGLRDPPGATELAVRTLARRLDMGEGEIHRTLEQGDSSDFAQTELYQRVFALAGRIDRRALPHAVLPRITLHSPKITRKLTTAWYAKRVDARYHRCMAQAAAR